MGQAPLVVHVSHGGLRCFACGARGQGGALRKGQGHQPKARGFCIGFQAKGHGFGAMGFHVVAQQGWRNNLGIEPGGVRHGPIGGRVHEARPVGASWPIEIDKPHAKGRRVVSCRGSKCFVLGLRCFVTWFRHIAQGDHSV